VVNERADDAGHSRRAAATRAYVEQDARHLSRAGCVAKDALRAALMKRLSKISRLWRKPVVAVARKAAVEATRGRASRGCVAVDNPIPRHRSGVRVWWSGSIADGAAFINEKMLMCSGNILQAGGAEEYEAFIKNEVRPICTRWRSADEES
jgi:hypothetical protein